MNRRIAVAMAAMVVMVASGLGFALGTTFYIDPAGSDNNTGTLGSPWQTIGYGLSRAESGDTLVLAAGTFNEHGLTISKDMHVIGQGPDATIIDGQYLNRVLNISTTATVTIDNLTIQKGQAPTVSLDAQPGGGIHNAGALTLIRCRIATSRAGQGGMYQGTAGPGGHGGGIYTVGTLLTMVDCEVTGNAAGNGAGTYSGESGGDGGGIFVAAGAALTASNCRIEANTAGSGDGAEYAGGGGNGGGIRCLGTASLTGCVVTGNRAGNGGGGEHAGSGGSGGGIFTSGTLTIVTSRIEGNTAGYGQKGGTCGDGGSGGGIWSTGTCSLSQTRIVGNAAGNGAGNGSDRSAAGSAGGIFASGPTTLTACQVTGNRVGVPGTYTGDPDGAMGYGGGLYLSNNTATLVNCTIGTNDGGATGGLLAAGASCRVTIRHCTVYGNRADASVGGVGLSAGAGVTVSNSIISSNAVGLGFLDIARLDAMGTVTSLGYNLVQAPGAISFTAAGDLVGQNPLLASLGDYGGPTQTFVPTPNSPAVDCIPGDNPNLTPTDQRGYSRPIGSGGDIGAIEVFPSSLSTATPTDIQGSSATSGGEVYNTGITVSARGVCWNESGTPTVADNHTEDGDGIGVFTSQIIGLTAGTTYHVRAYLVCGFGTFYGNEVTFTTDTLPTVTTGATTAITGFTADVNGTVTHDGGDPAVTRGICWSTSPGPTRSGNNTLDNGTGAGGFSCQLMGLTSGTLYYVRAFATNNVGTAYGQEVTFTTDTLATVTTGTVSDISAVSANCTGEVIADGGEPVTARGLCWGTSPNPTTADSTNDPGQGTGLFAAAMAPLPPATLYYVRAYATNSVGTAYGEVKSFTTLATLPDIITLPVVNVTASEAQSGGRIMSDGGDAVLVRGVCWGTSSDPTTFDVATKDGTGIGEFVSTMTNLQPGVIYYVRAYATNSVGTRYGPILALTTSKALPTPTDTPTPTPTIEPAPTEEPTPTLTPTPIPVDNTTQERWLTLSIPLPYWCTLPGAVVLAIVMAGFLGLSKLRE